jgi:hypothetical protein
MAASVLNLDIDSIPEPMTGCWLWLRGFAGNGYPHLYINGKSYKASRYVYETHNGALAKTEVVRHVCHNPACVNPAHLRKGTQKQNIQDSCVSGRMNIKLTDSEVLAILKEYVPFVVSLNTLAKKFKVSKKNILNIVKGRIYKHIYNLHHNTEGQ